MASIHRMKGVGMYCYPKQGEVQCRVCDRVDHVYEIRDGERPDVRYRATIDSARELGWLLSETDPEGSGVCPDCG